MYETIWWNYNFRNPLSTCIKTVDDVGHANLPWKPSAAAVIFIRVTEKYNFKLKLTLWQLK